MSTCATSCGHAMLSKFSRSIISKILPPPSAEFLESDGALFFMLAFLTFPRFISDYIFRQIAPKTQVVLQPHGTFAALWASIRRLLCQCRLQCRNSRFQRSDPFAKCKYANKPVFAPRQQFPAEMTLDRCRHGLILADYSAAASMAVPARMMFRWAADGTRGTI